MSVKSRFWDHSSVQKPKSSDPAWPSSRFQLLRFYDMLLSNLIVCTCFFVAAGEVGQVQLSQLAVHLTGSLQGSSAQRLQDNDMHPATAQPLLFSAQSPAGFMDDALHERRQDMDSSGGSIHSDNLRVYRNYGDLEVEDSTHPGRNLKSMSDNSAMDGKNAKNQESSNNISFTEEYAIANSDINDFGASDNSSAVHICVGQECGGNATTSVDGKSAAPSTGSSNMGNDTSESSRAEVGNENNSLVSNGNPGDGTVAITPPVYGRSPVTPVYGSSSSNPQPPPPPTTGTSLSPPQSELGGQPGQQEETSDVGCPSATRISVRDVMTGDCGADRVLLQVSLVDGKPAAEGNEGTAADGVEATVLGSAAVQSNSTALMCAPGPTFNVETSSLNLTLCWRPEDLPEGEVKTTAVTAVQGGNNSYGSNVTSGLIMTLRFAWYGISSMAPGDYSLMVRGADSFGAVVHATAKNNVSVSPVAAPPAIPAVTSPPPLFDVSPSAPPPRLLAVANTVFVPAGGISALTVWFYVAAASNPGSSNNNHNNKNKNGAGSGSLCDSSSTVVGSLADPGPPSQQQGAETGNGNGNGNGNGRENGNSSRGNGNGNGPCRSVTITLVRQILPSAPMTSTLPPVLSAVQASHPLTSATPPPASVPVPSLLTSTPPYTLPMPSPSPAVFPSYRCKCPHTAPSPTACPSGFAPLAATPFLTAATAALPNDTNLTSAVQCVPPPLYDKVTRRLTFSTCWRHSCLAAVFVRQPPYELVLGPMSLTEATSPPAGMYRMRTWLPSNVIMSYESLGAASSSSWETVASPAAASGNDTLAINRDVRVMVPYGGLRQISIRIQMPADPDVDDTSVSLEVALLRLDTTSEVAANKTGQAGSSDTSSSGSSSGMVLETPDGSAVAVPPPVPAIALTNANTSLTVVSELWINRRIINSSNTGEGNGARTDIGSGGSSQQGSSVSELIELLRQGMVSAGGGDPSVSKPQNAAASNISEDSVTLQGFRLTLPLGIKSLPSTPNLTTTLYPPSYETTTPGGMLADCSEASLTALRASAATALAEIGDPSYSTATLASMGCLYGSYDGAISGRRRALLQTQTCTAVVTAPLVVDVPPVDLDSYLTIVTSSLASVYGDSACPLDPASADIGVISKLAISISLPASKVLPTSSASPASGTDGTAMAACTTGPELLASSLGLVEGEAHLVGCQLYAEVKIQEATSTAATSDTTTSTSGSLLTPTKSGAAGASSDQQSNGSTKHASPLAIIIAAGIAATAAFLLAAIAVVAIVNRRRRIQRRETLKLPHDTDLTSPSTASAWASRIRECGSRVSYDGDGGDGGSKKAALVTRSPSKRLRWSTRSGDGYNNDFEDGEIQSCHRLTEYSSQSLGGGEGDNRRIDGDVGDGDRVFLAVVPTSPIVPTEEIPSVWYGSALPARHDDSQTRRASQATISPYSEGAVGIGWYDYFGLNETECDAYDKVGSPPISNGGDRGFSNGNGGSSDPRTARTTFLLRRSNAGNLAWLQCSDLSNEEELSDSIIVSPSTSSPALAASPQSSPDGNRRGPRTGTAVAFKPPPMLSTVRALRLSFAIPGADPALYGYEDLDSVSAVVQRVGDGVNMNGGVEEDGELLRVQSRRPAFLDATGGSLAAAVAATVAVPRRAVRHLYGALIRQPSRGTVAAATDRQGGGSGSRGSDSRGSAGRGYIRRNTIVPYRGNISTSYLSYKYECQCADLAAPGTILLSAGGCDRPAAAWSAPGSSVDNTYDSACGVVQQSPFCTNTGNMYDVVDRSAWGGVVVDTSRRNSCSNCSPAAAASRGSGPRQSHLSGSVSEPAGGCTTTVAAASDGGDCRTLRQPPRLQNSCRRLLRPTDIDTDASTAPDEDGADGTAATLAAADYAVQGAGAAVQSSSEPAASSSAKQQAVQQLVADAAPSRLLLPAIHFARRKPTLPPIQPNTPQTRDVNVSSSYPTSPSTPPPPTTSSPPPYAHPSPSRTTAVTAIPPPVPPATVQTTTTLSSPPCPTRTSPRLDDILPVATLPSFTHPALSPSTNGPHSPPRSPRPWILRQPQPPYTCSSFASSSFASLSALPAGATTTASGDGSSLVGLVDPEVEAYASGGAARLAHLRQLTVGPPRHAWGLVHAGVLPFRRSIASLQYIQNPGDRPTPTPRDAAAAVSLAAAAAAASGIMLGVGAGSNEHGEYRRAVPGGLWSRHSTGSMSVESTESAGFSDMKFEL